MLEDGVDILFKQDWDTFWLFKMCDFFYYISLNECHFCNFVFMKVLLFGVPSRRPKDEVGSSADDDQSPVVLAVKKIKENYPQLTVACDVCIKIIKT